MSIPLRVVLLLGITGLVLLSAGSILAINVRAGGETARELMLQRSSAVLHGLEQWLRLQLRPLSDVARNAQAMVAEGALAPDDTAHVDAYVHGLFAGTPRLEALALVTPDHVARRYGRDGIARIDDWSDRAPVAGLVDEVIERAKAGNIEPVWGTPVWRGSTGHAAFHIRVALMRNGAPAGVLFAMIGLEPIVSALPRLLVDEVMIPYILYDRTRVLAHPLLDTGAALGPDPTTTAPRPLLALDDFPDAHLAMLWDAEPMRMKGPVDLKPGWAQGIHLDGETIVHTLRDVQGFSPRPLQIGTHFTTTEGAPAFVRLRNSIAVGLGVLALSVVAALLLGRWIGRPVVRFATVARAVAAGNLNPPMQPQPSLIREYQEGGAAFQSMVEGLRERERVRNLFGKYVPEEVARRLLAQDGDPRPDETEATILFADLTDFTRLTQVLGPERVVRMLNAYFSAMVEILERHGGVVTQFQGDAMLVVFNLPERHPDHASAAVLAALEMQRRLDAGPFEGQTLHARIGIGTGTVLAGAVGAQDRLSYTVHGDAVNLAARLEVMNKSIGTRILVSDRTATLVRAVPLLSLGHLPVRGQGAEARVFTPEEDRGQPPRELPRAGSEPAAAGA
ncbi:class 3 adenylate cyclase [Roseospira goensis]|uniref:Class 3 adenylate cyclase n=1 Tax=Roseospira goensis TaxID=391922 RepID=A0A7W6WK94_9PROT|nr:class 3 adenylate cyclase [Roseospira goensis]